MCFKCLPNAKGPTKRVIQTGQPHMTDTTVLDDVSSNGRPCCFQIVAVRTEDSWAEATRCAFLLLKCVKEIELHAVKAAKEQLQVPPYLAQATLAVHDKRPWGSLR